MARFVYHMRIGPAFEMVTLLVCMCKYIIEIIGDLDYGLFANMQSYCLAISVRFIVFYYFFIYLFNFFFGKSTLDRLLTLSWTPDATFILIACKM